MASTQSSDRERLRQLVDGDQKVLRTLQEKRDFKQAPKKLLHDFSAGCKKIVWAFSRWSRFSFPINKVLIGIALVIAAYLVFDLIKIFQWQQASTAPKFSKPIEMKATPVSELGSLDSYLDGVRGKDLFGSLPETMGRSVMAESMVSAPAQTYEGLKLVGISYEGIPEALIEDTRTGKTYFVKEGAWVGDKKIERIDRDKVIIRHQNEEIELK